jgi:hypothetical protein
MRSSAKLLQTPHFHSAPSAQISQITPIAGRAICGSEPDFLIDARNTAAQVVGLPGAEDVPPSLRVSKLQKMRRSLMLRKTLLLAIVAGAALLVAGPSPASASLFSFDGGCGGGCGASYGGCGGGCGCHHHAHHCHVHHHGCGCGYSGGCGGCGAPVMASCGAPAPMACSSCAPTCAAPAATCCGASYAPSCAVPAAPSCGAPGVMAPSHAPVQAAPAPPPEEPAPKPKA